MPATEAQIRANQANSLKSSGPKSPEGKAIARANSFKHGLTGAGVVLPNEDAEEVERRFEAYRDELRPSCEVTEALVRRAALLSIRLDRCTSYETATLSGRIRQADADFVAPDGVDAATAAQLRAEAKARAMFDPSKEATLARRYEAAAERGFFHALKEVCKIESYIERVQPGVDPEVFQETLGSFLQLKQRTEELEARLDITDELPLPNPGKPFQPADFGPIGVTNDVPMTIGRRR